MNDLRLALRRLVSVPSFTVAVVGTLALGIGPNALVFSALSGLLLRPLPFVDADRLVWVFARTAASATPDTITGDEADALAAHMRTLDRVAVIGDRGLVREVGNRHLRWTGLWVTSELDEVLAITPAAGRAFTRADTRPAATPAMMVGYERWLRDFGGDASIVGRELQFADNKQFIVIGILPRGLEFPFGRSPHTGNGTGFVVGTQDFWVLGQDDPLKLPGGVTLARLTSEATPGNARAEAETLAAGLAAQHHAANDGRTFTIVPLRDQVLGSLSPALPVLQCFAALVFLIACVNAASLILVRAAGSATETAVRVALGARRSDLARIAAAESLWLATAGAAVGLALAWSGRAVLAAIASSSPAILARIELDGRVFLFAFALSILTAMVLTLLPSMAISRFALASTLNRHRQTFGGRGPLLRGLVASQIALSMILLLGAGVLRESLHRLLSVDTGYEAERVLTADVLLFIRHPQPVIRQLVERLRGLPGVQAVGLIHSTPLTGKWNIRDSFVIGRGSARRETPPIPGNMVAFEYFEAMGIPVLAGRDFTEQEFLAANPPSIIINDLAARTFFPGSNPVGTRVLMFGAPREIVGIVKATRDDRLDSAPEPQWYQPMFFGSSQIVVRTAGDPSHRVETVRRELAAADPRLIVTRVETLEAIAADSVLERRMTSGLVTAFAGVALALALLGLSGVMHFSVARRAREFGVRTALGAGRTRIVAMVIREGFTMTASGIAIALLVSLPLAGSVQRLPFEVDAINPRVMAGATLAVVLVSVAACVRPAWRAAGVDPAVTLRGE